MELKPIFEFLTELKGGAADRDAKIAEYKSRLEDEMRKIEVFKRELPLSMLILQDAIERLKEEDGVVMVEEFIPMKKKKDDEKNGGLVFEKENSDRKSWMRSVQLWSSTSFDDTKSERNEDVDRSVPENSIQMSKKRSRGGAFAPFKKNFVTEDKEVSEVPSLSLGTPMCEANAANSGSFRSGARGGFGLSMVKLQIEAQQMSHVQQQQQQQQCFRKQRRCWSPELHHRFVDALKQLGGSQVATPKQIRELMQVDGLTNDEVKSHLQKYRLHIRKVPGSSATEANGSWMNQDHCGDNSKENYSQSRSPQGPLLAKGGPSTTGGDSSETEEDDQKSDGYSWKTACHNSSGDV